MIPAPRWSIISNLFREFAIEWTEFFDKLRNNANVSEDNEELLAGEVYNAKQDDYSVRLSRLERLVLVPDLQTSIEKRLLNLEKLVFAANEHSHDKLKNLIDIARFLPSNEHTHGSQEISPDRLGRNGADNSIFKLDYGNRRAALCSEITEYLLSNNTYDVNLFSDNKDSDTSLAFGIRAQSNTANRGVRLIFLRSRLDGAAPDIVQNGDAVARLQFAAYDEVEYAMLGEISIEVDGTPAENDMPGRVIVKLSPSGSETPVEVFRLSQDKTATFASTIKGIERSSDPTEPSEGEYVIWMSDGTGKGDDGDIMIASKAGGTTNYGTLFDHSGGAAW